MVPALGDLGRNFLDLKAQNVSVKELKLELMQNALLAPHKDAIKKPECRFAALLTGTLEVL